MLLTRRAISTVAGPGGVVVVLPPHNVLRSRRSAPD
jgi:hypothetical protein